jgi:hypothetical protein
MEMSIRYFATFLRVSFNKLGKLIKKLQYCLIRTLSGQSKTLPRGPDGLSSHLVHGPNAADSGSGTNYSVPAIYNTVRRNISMHAIAGRAFGSFFGRIVSSQLRK